MNMKQSRLYRFLIALVVALAVLCSPAPATASEEDPFSATLTEFSGEVLIQKPDDETWLPVEENMALEESDRLKTGDDSSAEILLDDGSVLKVEADSEILVRELSAEADTKRVESTIFLKLGRLLSNIARFVHKESRFTVKTPTAVCGVRGTEFVVETSDTEQADVGVFDGEVAVSGVDQTGAIIEGSEVLLGKGNQTLVKRGKRPLRPFAFKANMRRYEKRMIALRKKAVERRRNLKKIIGKRRKAHEKWRRLRKDRIQKLRKEQLRKHKTKKPQQRIHKPKPIPKKAPARIRKKVRKPHKPPKKQ